MLFQVARDRYRTGGSYIGRQDEGCCETTPSNSDNSSESLNVSQSVEFIEDPGGREIVGSGTEGIGKGVADGSFIGVGEPKVPSMHCSFCGVSGVLIYMSGRGG